MAEEQEALEENDEEDLLLDDERAEAEDADADLAPSFAAELRAGGFSSYAPKPADEQSHDYAIKKSQIGATLQREGDAYVAFKCAPLEARRTNAAVAETTAQGDLQNFYRFLGFLKIKGKLPDGDAPFSLGLLAHASAPQWVADWVDFMKDERGLAFSSMANYINAIFSLATYVEVDLP